MSNDDDSVADILAPHAMGPISDKDDRLIGVTNAKPPQPEPSPYGVALPPHVDTEDGTPLFKTAAEINAWLSSGPPARLTQREIRDLLGYDKNE